MAAGSGPMSMRSAAASASPGALGVWPVRNRSNLRDREEPSQGDRPRGPWAPPGQSCSPCRPHIQHSGSLRVRTHLVCPGQT